MFIIHILIACITICVVKSNRIFDTHFNSQHYINGTTLLERHRHESKISVLYHDPVNASIPLFNYSNFFNRLQMNKNEFDIYSTEIPDVLTSLNLTRVEDRRKKQECEDDKVELDFLHYKSISLENNLTRLAIDCNFALDKYDKCKTDKLHLERKLNFTVDSLAACKSFCENG